MACSQDHDQHLHDVWVGHEISGFQTRTFRRRRRWSRHCLLLRVHCSVYSSGCNPSERHRVPDYVRNHVLGEHCAIVLLLQERVNYIASAVVFLAIYQESMRHHITSQLSV